MKGQTKKRGGRASTLRAIQVQSGAPFGQLMGGIKVECRVGNLPSKGMIWVVLPQTRTAQSILNGYH
eukprot:1142417-Pleurochrysis_carterae.AAC.1